MRKKIFVLIVIMVLCLKACSRNSKYFENLERSNEIINSSEIVAIIKEDKVNSSTENITLIIENKTNNTYTYGLNFNLEIEKEGVWYKIPFKDGVAFIEIGYILQKSSKVEEQIKLSYFPQLSEGKYRITKVLFSQKESITVGAEFKIENK